VSALSSADVSHRLSDVCSTLEAGIS